MVVLADVFDVFSHEDNLALLIPILAVGGGVLIAIVAIIFTNLRSIFVARSREQTKRELAAYVAEGSIDPDKAIALANAGLDASDDESA